jgi:hypothetical protein
MAEEGNSWKKDLLIAGVLAPVVGAVVSPLVKGLLGSVGVSYGWLTWVSGGVVAAATSKVSVWVIVLVLTAALSVYLLRTSLATPSAKDVMNEFTSAEIKGVLWVWSWIRATRSPTHPRPMCPECRMELPLEEWHDTSNRSISNSTSGPAYLNRGEPDGTKAECDKCGFTKTWPEKENELTEYVQKEIVRQANTGEWVENQLP